MKNYLITGGCGFIGSNLCSFLLKDNKDIKIICVDNLSSSSELNLEDLLLNFNDRICFINKNITSIDYDKILIDLNINKIDKIFHLACMASPVFYQKYPIETLDTCYLGTKKILELARKHNCRIIFTSTSEVYGNPTVPIQNEDYLGNVNSIGIRACYDEGKRVSETLCMEYKRVYNVNIGIIRIFNTYGPKMSKHDGRVIPNFINQCLNNTDITIYGDGSQTRSFCYIKDMIHGIIAMMKSNESGPINIGNNVEYKIIDIANYIKKLTNSNSNIVFKNLPCDDPLIRKPCLKKAKNLLNWQPNIKLKSGLLKTINYFKLN